MLPEVVGTTERSGEKNSQVMIQKRRINDNCAQTATGITPPDWGLSGLTVCVLFPKSSYH